MTSRQIRRARASGTILIVTMWITMALAALVLMLAQTMHVEIAASANEASIRQAEAIEMGAIQYVLARTDGLKGVFPADADAPGEAIPVGTGAFWLIRRNPDDDRAWAFGLIDEAGKINLNQSGGAPTSVDVLVKLPNMTNELAAGIVDWADPDDTVTPGGAESEYYLLLADGYQCKNAPFETVDELLLVKDITPEILYGEDINRNNVLDDNEDDADVSLPPDNHDGRLDRGLYPFVTVHSVEPNTDSAGQARININSDSLTTLSNLLTQKLSSSKAGSVMALVRPPPRLGTPPPARTQFTNVFDFAVRTGLTATEFGTVVDQLTLGATNQPRRGLVNVNTAPAEVLAALPGLDESDAAALIAQRAQNAAGSTDMAWVLSALTPAKAVAIGNMITGRTYRFSADIVSVSGDGRAFRRCRIVVDAQSSPPKVLYRQDLTHLGWPLDKNILDSLRKGVSMDKLSLTQSTQQQQEVPK